MEVYCIWRNSMKKIVAVSVITACALLYVFMHVTPIHTKNTLFDEQYHPTRPLRDILELTGIKHNGTIEDIVIKTQEAWLSKQKERWYMDQTPHPEHDKLTELFKQIDAEDALTPKKNHYTYALLMGATAFRMKLRLDYLLEQISKGITFDELIMISGERPLDPAVEDPARISKIFNTPLELAATFKTEGDVMEYLKSQLPSEILAKKVTVVRAPMKQLPDGSFTRPTVGDIIPAWLKKANPQPGTCLVVSNQPYVHYQEASVRLYLPDTFEIDAIGDAASATDYDPVKLDNLARWIYFINQQRLKNQKPSSKL